jgi:hypothetical protein
MIVGRVLGGYATYLTGLAVVFALTQLHSTHTSPHTVLSLVAYHTSGRRMNLDIACGCRVVISIKSPVDISVLRPLRYIFQYSLGEMEW